MRALTSAKNPLLKEIRKAVSRGTLTADGLCVAEGFHLLDEALRSRAEIAGVLAAESAAADVERRTDRFTLVPDALLREIASTETTQGVITLVRPRTWSIDQLFLPSPSLILVLDGIQDPGNAGAILRAAEAFGATGVLFVKGSVSPYNPKALRGSAGSVFRLPVLTGLSPSGALPALSSLKLYATLPDAGLSITDAPLAEPCAFILGSEGSGVSSLFRDASTPLRIPTRSVESLNVAMAAAILVYEARRQRT